MRQNTATPLLRNIFKILGRSKCEVLSCVDLKDAFHSLGLTDNAKELCGILPYFRSAHYRYEVLPVGLSISSQVWITYIENLLEGIPNRQSYIAIMDDLMLHGLKSQHMALFEHLLTSLISHGLKLPPQKVPTFHETPCISWQRFSYRRWSDYYHNHEKQDRSHTKVTTPYYCERM